MYRNMDVLISTRNQFKATEMAYYLEGLVGVKMHFMKDTAINITVEEDQNSLEANAQKKAREISKLTDWYVLASDGGVHIPGLGDKWDVLRNQRTVGEGKTDQEKVEVLIELMKGLKGEERKCVYYLALAVARKGQLLWSAEGITDIGYITTKPEKTAIPPSRWMGHIWYYPVFKKTFNQMNEAERNEVRKVGAKLKNQLQAYIRSLI